MASVAARRERRLASVEATAGVRPDRDRHAHLIAKFAAAGIDFDALSDEHLERIEGAAAMARPGEVMAIDQFEAWIEALR